MRLLGLATIVLVVAACATNPAPTAPPSTPPAGPSDATDADGRFRLDFALPNATFTEAEAIEGLATLSLLGPGGGKLGASGGGPISFGIREVGGDREIGPASDASCAPFEIGEASPIRTGITKSGGWSADDPNAAFYDAFFRDPELHLPAGAWDITAYATFSEGECTANPHDLSATVRVVVTPAP